MKYEVTFSCGHTHIIELFGKMSERERKIKYFEDRGVCPDCFREMREAEKSIGCAEIEMLYKEYKKNYADCNTKSGSYNGETKTIIVYIPNNRREEIATNAPQSSAKEDDSSSDLPELTGTDLQINYANRIRKAVLSIAEKMELDELITTIKSETSSEWFINTHQIRCTLDLNHKSSLQQLEVSQYLVDYNINLILAKMSGAKLIDKNKAVKKYRELYSKLQHDFLRDTHLK